MPRIDDYQQAVDLGKKALSDKTPDLLASFAGADLDRGGRGDISLSLRFLNRKVLCPWPGLIFSDKETQEDLPIQQQVLLMHYLMGACNSEGAPVTGEWIAFQDVPDGRFYLDAFLRRAKVPLVSTFGPDPDRLQEAAGAAYGATVLDHGDIAVKVQALPLVPVALILWRGDEEFPPEGNLLFDRNIIRIFSAEDIAWLSGLVVYPLLGTAKGKG